MSEHGSRGPRSGPGPSRSVYARFKTLTPITGIVADPRVIVIGETASLGSSIMDLLSADGIEATEVPSLAAAQLLDERTEDRRRALLICASTRSPCDSARRWANGAFANADLIVVGSQDAAASPRNGVHLVSLPLRADEFLRLVRSLLSGGSTGIDLSPHAG
jgi:hypothetical protein